MVAYVTETEYAVPRFLFYCAVILYLLYFFWGHSRETLRYNIGLRGWYKVSFRVYRVSAVSVTTQNQDLEQSLVLQLQASLPRVFIQNVINMHGREYLISWTSFLFDAMDSSELLSFFEEKGLCRLYTLYRCKRDNELFPPAGEAICVEPARRCILVLYRK